MPMGGRPSGCFRRAKVRQVCHLRRRVLRGAPARRGARRIWAVVLAPRAAPRRTCESVWRRQAPCQTTSRLSASIALQMSPSSGQTAGGDRLGRRTTRCDVGRGLGGSGQEGAAAPRNGRVGRIQLRRPALAIPQSRRLLPQRPGRGLVIMVSSKPLLRARLLGPRLGIGWVRSKPVPGSRWGSGGARALTVSPKPGQLRISRRWEIKERQRCSPPPLPLGLAISGASSAWSWLGRRHDGTRRRGRRRRRSPCGSARACPSCRCPAGRLRRGPGTRSWARLGGPSSAPGTLCRVRRSTTCRTTCLMGDWPHRGGAQARCCGLRCAMPSRPEAFPLGLAVICGL